MRRLLAFAIVATLAACRAEPAPEAGRATAPPPATSAPAAAGPAPAPAPTSATPADGSDHQATFAGYGDVKFGTPAADMEKAWGGELKEEGKDFNAACYFMTPVWVKTPDEFNFMISDGRFARFATRSEKYVAPGGGKVGMREAQLQALYNQALQSAPHKYVEGKYLSINASGIAPTKLVFETDARGVVTEWRLGLLPEADYVEGCS